MKLIYLANIRIPTEKAHGIQIMQMCDSFASFGAQKNLEVELIVPRRLNKIKQDPFNYYSIEKHFKIIYLPCFDVLPWARYLGALSLVMQTISFFIAAFFYLLNKNFDFIYTRDEAAFLFLPWRRKMIWEAHNFSSGARFLNYFLRQAFLIVAITESLKRYLIKASMPQEKIFVVPDGVNIKQFDLDVSLIEARKKTGLPLDKKIILYTGHFYKWKGVETILQAVQFLPQDTEAILVGGFADDIKKVQSLDFDFSRIKLIGQRPHNEVPYYLKAADVLILPNSQNDQISREFTSPLKLFEYMIACRPIVASNLPSIREILGDVQNALLFEPDNPRDLASKVITVLNDEDLAKKLSFKAFFDAQNYSWDKRAEKIMSFIDVKAKK